MAVYLFINFHMDVFPLLKWVQWDRWMYKPPACALSWICSKAEIRTTDEDKITQDYCVKKNSKHGRTYGICNKQGNTQSNCWRLSVPCALASNHEELRSDRQGQQPLCLTSVNILHSYTDLSSSHVPEGATQVENCDYTYGQIYVQSNTVIKTSVYTTPRL
jgi:hypothetical protein